MNKIEKSIKESSSAFIHLVWPEIKTGIGGGELIAVEGVTTDAMSRQFDAIAGIDFWQIMQDDKGIRGIASRCQPIKIDYHTFTIRRTLKSGRETEYHKRIRAINGDIEGLQYPAITVQAYMKSYSGPLISVGYIKTKDLYKAITDHEWPKLKNHYEGNEFLVVDWYKLQEWGYNVRIRSYT